MPVQPKGTKDAATLLETVRQFGPGDPAYYELLNTPMVDIGERCIDLDTHLLPARGLRVRQVLTATTSVEVEIGYTIIEDPSIAEDWTLNSTRAAVSTIAVAAAAGSMRRIDLVYFDLEADAPAKALGTEVADSVAWATVFSASRGKLPSHSQGANVPLAYVYVDETPTDFDEAVAIDNAGHIRDARLGPSARRRRLNDAPGDLATDNASGGTPTAVVGTSRKGSRHNHGHPLNVNDPSLPEQVTATATGDDTVALSNRYSRSDHRHFLRVITDPGHLKSDISSGLVGIHTEFARATHRHRANLGATLPSNMTADAPGATPWGSSNFYVRPNHSHDISGASLSAVPFTLFWNAENIITGSPDRSTGALAGEPIAALFFGTFFETSTDYVAGSLTTAASCVTYGAAAKTGASTWASICAAMTGSSQQSTMRESMYMEETPISADPIGAIPFLPRLTDGRGWHDDTSNNGTCNVHFNLIAFTASNLTVRAARGPTPVGADQMPVQPIITGYMNCIVLMQA